MDLDPGVEDVAERRVGRRLALLVDLRKEPGTDLLCLALVLRRLGEVTVLTGQRVETGVDQHLVGVPTTPYEASLAALCATLRRHVRSVLIDSSIDRPASR